MNLTTIIINLCLALSLLLLTLPSVKTLQLLGTLTEIRLLVHALQQTSLYAMASGHKQPFQLLSQDYQTQGRKYPFCKIKHPLGESTYDKEVIWCYPNGSIEAGSFLIEAIQYPQRYRVAIEVTPLAPPRIYKEQHKQWIETQ